MGDSESWTSISREAHCWNSLAVWVDGLVFGEDMQEGEPRLKIGRVFPETRVTLAGSFWNTSVFWHPM